MFSTREHLEIEDEIMGTKSPQELIRLWELEKITTEQAIGHILQNMVRIQKEYEELTATLHKLLKQIKQH